MKLELAYYGDPILRKKCTKVEQIDAAIKLLVEQMADALIEHNGIGIAAPQVKRSVRLFITAVPTEQDDGSWLAGNLKVYINPKILWVSKEKAIQSEGCLSIPKVNGDVERPVRIKVSALDINGKEFEEELSDLEARCFLHENDHINGVLFIDRIKGKEKKKLSPFLNQIKKTYPT